jgi:hypothetical protein
MAGIRISLRPLRGLPAALAALASAISPAAATGQITCETPGGKEAALSYTVGSVPVLAVVNARIDAFGQTWSMSPQGGETAVIVGQAAQDGSYTIIDFVDPNVEQVLVSVRLHRSTEGDASAQAGTLRAPGFGVTAIVCEGP